LKKALAIAVILIIYFSTFTIVAPVKANNQLPSSSPPAGYTPLVPDEKNGTATAMIIEDVVPWNYDLMPSLLHSLEFHTTSNIHMTCQMISVNISSLYWLPISLHQRTPT